MCEVIYPKQVSIYLPKKEAAFYNSRKEKNKRRVMKIMLKEMIRIETELMLHPRVIPKGIIRYAK
jgi:hypothetical protein